jgi:hypothetical protein
MLADKPADKLPLLYPNISTHYFLNWVELMSRYYYYDSLLADDPDNIQGLIDRICHS